MNKDNDPRDHMHLLVLAESQGEITLRAGSIETVLRYGTAKLKVSFHGHMTVYVHAVPGLYADLLRSMAQCAEYTDAEAEVAAQAIS
jgi:hypothetical protein